jgi:hypothetical protein
MNHSSAMLALALAERALQRLSSKALPTRMEELK